MLPVEYNKKGIVVPNKLIAIHLDYAGFVRNKQVRIRKKRVIGNMG